MSSSSDPYAPKFPRTTVERYFGPKSSAKDAQRLRLENPPMYDEMRHSAEHDYHLIGTRSYFRPEDRPRDPNAPRQFSAEEIKARALFSEQDCRDLFKGIPGQPGNTHNPANLQKESPELFRLAKIAAVAYDILPPNTFIPAPESKTQPPVDQSIAVGDALCRELNLPAGYRVPNHDALKRIIAVAAEVRDAKAKAQKDAGDPPAESVAA
jgi:hypothetical protein